MKVVRKKICKKGRHEGRKTLKKEGSQLVRKEGMTGGGDGGRKKEGS